MLERLGATFFASYGRDTRKAWEDLLLDMMRHLDVLAQSDFVTQVKDVINIAKDIEDQIRKGAQTQAKTPDGERRLPMDLIGAQWRLDLPSGELTAPATTKVSRRKAASFSKSKTSSASPISSAKTSSETNGSEK